MAFVIRKNGALNQAAAGLQQGLVQGASFGLALREQKHREAVQAHYQEQRDAAIAAQRQEDMAAQQSNQMLAQQDDPNAALDAGMQGGPGAAMAVQAGQRPPMEQIKSVLGRLSPEDGARFVQELHQRHRQVAINKANADFVKQIGNDISLGKLDVTLPDGSSTRDDKVLEGAQTFGATAAIPDLSAEQTIQLHKDYAGLLTSLGKSDMDMKVLNSRVGMATAKADELAAAGNMDGHDAVYALGVGLRRGQISLEQYHKLMPDAELGLIHFTSPLDGKDMAVMKSQAGQAYQREMEMKQKLDAMNLQLQQSKIDAQKAAAAANAGKPEKTQAEIGKLQAETGAANELAGWRRRGGSKIGGAKDASEKDLLEEAQGYHKLADALPKDQADQAAAYRRRAQVLEVRAAKMGAGTKAAAAPDEPDYDAEAQRMRDAGQSDDQILKFLKSHGL